MGLKAEDAQIYLIDPTDSTSMSEEACDPIGSGSPSLWWQINDHEKDVWDPSVTFSVEVTTDGGSTWSPASTSNYTLHYLVGAVEFDSDPFAPSTSDNDVRVSGSFYPQSRLAEGFETDVSFGSAVLDTTQFQDEAPHLIKGLKSLSGSFGTFRMRETNIDRTSGFAGADDDGPTMREVLFDSATQGSGNSTQPFTVFRFTPADQASPATILSAFVQLSEESLEASSGDPQNRSFSMTVDKQESTMSSQPAASVDIISPAQL